MATPIVDLSAITPLAEIILRAGDVHDPRARSIFQNTYKIIDPIYPDAIGISTLFRVGATLDELAHEGMFPNPKLSFSVVGQIMGELATIGYELVLYITPALNGIPPLPDHHSLAVAQHGFVQGELPDDAADALLRALTVIDNPYRRPKPKLQKP